MSYLYLIISLPLIYTSIRKIFNGPKAPIKNFDSVKDKVVLITGCSAGIGKETAIHLLNNKAKVIFACRDEKKTMNIINNIPAESRARAIFISLDLCSFQSVKKFEKEFSSLNLNLDIIINNAGCMSNEYSKTKDNIETVIQCNHFSHVYLTTLLLKYMSNAGRIINVSSTVHSLPKKLDISVLTKDNEFKNDSLHSSNFYNYSYSKLANVYFTNTLARFFEENKICFKAVSLHPGVVKTELVRFNGILGKVISIFAYLFMSLFFKDACMGAQTTLHLCYIDYNSLINGGYYSDCKLDKISNLASNNELRKAYMQYTLNLLKTRISDLPEDLNDIIKY